MPTLSEIAERIKQARQNLDLLLEQRNQLICDSWAPGAAGRGDLKIMEIAEMCKITPAQVSKIIKTAVGKPVVRATLPQKTIEQVMRDPISRDYVRATTPAADSPFEKYYEPETDLSKFGLVTKLPEVEADDNLQKMLAEYNESIRGKQQQSGLNPGQDST